VRAGRALTASSQAESLWRWKEKWVWRRGEGDG